MVLDSIRGQNFHYLTVAWVKISIFLKLLWAHLCMLIIKKKDILILSLGLTQRLDDTKLTVEAQYSINFSRSNVKFCLSLIMIGATVFYLSVLQKYMNLKQKILQ